jgi:uncharacterized damage-inducible protein DinB
MQRPTPSVRSQWLLRLSRTLTAVALVAPHLAGGQAVPNRADAVEVRTQFLLDVDTLHKKFLALANAFPEEKYSWRPGPGVRSVGQVFMHVAAELYAYTPMAFGAQPSSAVSMDQKEMRKFEDMSTKADVLKHFEAAYAYTKTAVAGVDPDKLVGKQKLFGGSYNVVETTLAMDSDMHEHLGQLIAYARMNGITPPWSK